MGYLDDNGNPLTSTAPIAGRSMLPFDYSRIIAQPGETPEQTVARYQADYHARDAPDVLAALPQWLQMQQNGGGSPDLSTPQGQLATVSQWLQAGGFGGDDPNYWLGRINDTGGFTPQNLQYWQTRIAAGPQGGQPGGAYYDPGAAGTVNPLNPGSFSYPAFTDQFSNPNFQPPTGLTEQNDPGYEARLQLGAKALQDSAAAKGTLLSGQTVQDLNDYAQQFASNEYGNVYNRALNTYATNSQNNLQQYQQKYQQYLNGFNQAAQTFGTNLGAGQQAFGDVLGLSAQNFAQNQQNWQNQFNVAQMGLNAAGSAAGLGQNYANQAGGYITGAGNAQAAGTVGAGNAWQNSLGFLANYGAQLPFLTSGAAPASYPSGGYYGYYPPSGAAFGGYGATY